MLSGCRCRCIVWSEFIVVYMTSSLLSLQSGRALSSTSRRRRRSRRTFGRHHFCQNAVGPWCLCVAWSEFIVVYMTSSLLSLQSGRALSSTSRRRRRSRRTFDRHHFRQNAVGPSCRCIVWSEFIVVYMTSSLLSLQSGRALSSTSRRRRRSRRTFDRHHFRQNAVGPSCRCIVWSEFIVVYMTSSLLSLQSGRALSSTSRRRRRSRRTFDRHHFRQNAVGPSCRCIVWSEFIVVYMTSSLLSLQSGRAPSSTSRRRRRSRRTFGRHHFRQNADGLSLPLHRLVGVHRRLHDVIVAVVAVGSGAVVNESPST